MLECRRGRVGACCAAVCSARSASSLRPSRIRTTPAAPREKRKHKRSLSFPVLPFGHVAVVRATRCGGGAPPFPFVLPDLRYITH
eukprot:205053-Prorocentrum_minimum.AAC.2